MLVSLGSAMLVSLGSAMLVSLGSAGHVRAVIAATEVNKLFCPLSFFSLNKAKRAACLRAAALRGRVACKPAPTTPRRPAPAPAGARSPARPPLPAGLPLRYSSRHSCLPLPPVTVVYMRRFVAALIAEDKQAAS
ncbi:uncharacterized protein BDR25DRAFT_316035 [Lindgomyces ingoldianus]|uniref:Uncharacterized protein n=1 Tax=Lindgomyces ingoldianus TaxID=673940 RepID=A0ACB6QR53_9PLEO|nr:uncharacterized protein BDR25DRAFT_316035 [Lindgomyces ingoldianus]KAF2468562.1 hypothetical protein BDR25DRAFT_316035 [Lindgomyces ingoldianus]